MIATATTTEFEARLLIAENNIPKNLSLFPGELILLEKFLEALRTGVIAIHSASPTPRARGLARIDLVILNCS